MQYYITFEVSPLAALLRLQAVKQQFKTLVITARKGGGRSAASVKYNTHYSDLQDQQEPQKFVRLTPF